MVEKNEEKVKEKFSKALNNFKKRLAKSGMEEAKAILQIEVTKIPVIGSILARTIGERTNEEIISMLEEMEALSNEQFEVIIAYIEPLGEEISEGFFEIMSKLNKIEEKIQPKPPKAPTFKELMQACRKQVAGEISYLKGTAENEQDRKSKKYLHELYVERKEIEEELKNFLKQDEKNCYVVVGNAGIGKTNLLCHLAEEYGKKIPVLFYNALYITKPFEERICEDLNKIFNFEFETFKDVSQEINKIIPSPKINLIIIIDAINESQRPKALKIELANLIHENIGRRIKFYISCRDIDWEFFRKNNERFLNELYSERKEEILEGEGQFKELSSREFRGAWQKYKEAYGLSGELSKSVKKICRHPLMLRFLAEGFEGSKEEVPENIRRIEIFERYWFKKLKNIEMADLAEEYMFKIVAEMKDGIKFGKEHRTDLLKKEVIELLGVTTDSLESTLTKILSENLVTFLNWKGERVIGFTYEAFLEYVMARWVIYGNEYSWHRKDKNEVMLDFKAFIKEAEEYRTLRGVIQYQILMLEGRSDNIHIDMIERLSSDNDDWKRMVVYLLPILNKSENAVHVLEKYFKGKYDEEDKCDLAIRSIAITCLRKIKSKESIDILCKSLGERAEKTIRKRVIDTLVKIGDNAIEPLMETLRGSSRNPNSILARNASVIARGALEEIGEAAVEPLIAALKDDKIRGRAIFTLGNIGDSRAVEPLIALLNDGNHNLSEVAEALGKIGDARAVDPLMALLKGENIHARKKAAEALGKIGDARAVEPLMALLKGKNTDFEYLAKEAIEKIKSAQKEKRRE